LGEGEAVLLKVLKSFKYSNIYKINSGVEMPDSREILEIEKKIFNTFGEVAKSIGFSPIHGNIIAALLVGGSSLSLQDIAKKTGYSVSMISLSLDLLEILGIIRKLKKPTDRKLYIELGSDLLESLKRILLMRINKNISDSLLEFEQSKKMLENLKGENKKDVMKAIKTLEGQINRLKMYVDLLSDINLP
jgi:DNA-binding transcriptional regulator GbsR (MarR family)